MPALSIRIALDCFYLLIFYSEKFSTDVCRLPYAVNVNLNLSCATRTFHVLVVQNGIRFVVVQNNGKEMYKKFTARAICFFAN